MAVDSKSLVATLQDARLIDQADLHRLNGLQSQFSDPKALGAQLIQAGLLTPFQVNLLLRGRCADLVLGSYRLLDRLGEGGMGQVFKARHERLGRVVALKVIRKDKLADPTALDRFRRETFAAAQLDHPNIVRAFDADAVAGCQLLVMEFVDGVDLGQLVKRSGPLPIRNAVDYVRQGALGLQHAHEKGIIHRDIKPSNLLVARGQGAGVVKILDMGLARLQDGNADDPASATMTQTGSVVGTPDFIAPEQARSSRHSDGRSDIYSLGCTLYYLLTGQVPFPVGTVTERLLHHIMDEPRPVEQLRPEVPADLAAIVRKLMAKQPDKRYQTPAEVAAVLEAWLQGRTKSSPAVMKPIRRAAVKLGPRRLLMGAGVVVGLLVLLVFTSVLLLRSGASTPANRPTVAASDTTAARPTTPETPADADPTGTWKWTISYGKRPHESTLRVSREGNRLTGVMSREDGGRFRPVEDLVYKDGKLSFTVASRGRFAQRYEGKVSADTIKGKSSFDFGGQTRSWDWEAKRVKE